LEITEWEPCTAVGYAVGRRTIVVNASDSHSKCFCKASEFPCISKYWARARGLQKTVYFNWGSTWGKVWETLALSLGPQDSKVASSKLWYALS